MDVDTSPKKLAGRVNLLRPRSYERICQAFCATYKIARFDLTRALANATKYQVATCMERNRIINKFIIHTDILCPKRDFFCVTNLYPMMANTRLRESNN